MRRLRTQGKRKVSCGGKGARSLGYFLGGARSTLYVSADEIPAHAPSFSRLFVCADADLFRRDRSWQLFNWHESKKDKTYIAPPALAALSFVHKDAHIPGTPGRQPTPLRYFMLATAVGLVATAMIGIVMAYRFSQRPIVATVCLLAGIALPGLLLWVYR